MTAHAPIFCPVSDFIVIVEGNIPTSKTAEYTHKKYLARETGTYVTLPLMTAKHDCRRPRQCSYILHKPILASMPSIPSAKINHKLTTLYTLKYPFFAIYSDFVGDGNKRGSNAVPLENTAV